MRLIERLDHGPHFTDGEPDLEPPEELCVAELDVDAALEEDLDCELLGEDEVEEQLLQDTLDDLVHAADDHPGWVDGNDEFRCRRCQLVCHVTELADPGGWECRSCSG